MTFEEDFPSKILNREKIEFIINLLTKNCFCGKIKPYDKLCFECSAKEELIKVLDYITKLEKEHFDKSKVREAIKRFFKDYGDINDTEENLLKELGLTNEEKE